ncbi:tetratricopeptide repeat protein [Streptomyces sp. NPDC002835]
MSSEELPGVDEVPQVHDLPAPARLLAVALCTATRIEPELLRAMRVEIRPQLDVSAESGLWFGPWSLRSSAQHMALHRGLLAPLRDLLCSELARSQEGDLLRMAGQVVFRVHRYLSPTLALEERVTWAAVCADAGLQRPEADTDIDRMLEGALRAAVQVPGRRKGLRRWFTGAWQRFPERVRQTPTALELYEVLTEDNYPLGRRGSGQGHGVHLEGVDDVVVPVRHDGAHLTIGDATWPAEGVLVPDTQPRVLEVTHALDTWGDAQKVRVPRGGQLSLPVAGVPVFVRTARGAVYEVGARGSSEVMAYPARSSGPNANRGLLGMRVAELDNGDALRFGIAARMMPRGAAAEAMTTPDRLVRSELVRRMARAGDLPLPLFLSRAADRSRLVVVTGPRSSGRTRAAWEAVRQALSDWWVWCPPVIDRSQALLDAIRDDRLGSHTVLWLDDLDVCLSDAGSGEKVAGALQKVLTDPALAPLLLVATCTPLPEGGGSLGPAARALLARAWSVHAGTGQHGSAASATDAVSLACERVISLAVAAEPRHKITARGGVPARMARLVGRAPTLRQLFALWADAEHAAPVVALTGMPGIGKTALAVEAVHRARERGWFPGGVLWLNLRAGRFTADTLLEALGVPGDSMPSSEDEQWVLCSALVHQVTGAGRQPALMVLDDASSMDTAPLTHLAPGLSVLITTRAQGPREGTRMVVGPLSATDAAQLLALALPVGNDGESRVEREPEATLRLAEMCGRQPLALSIAARLLGDDPTLTVSSLVRAMEDASVQADVLSHGGQSLRAALDWSYGQLSPGQMSAFRLLGLTPGHDFTSTAAGALLGYSSDRLMRKLARLHLVQRGSPSSDRWRMNGLVKQYATDLGRLYVAEDQRTAALVRLMSHYEQCAREADAWTRDEHQAQAAVFSSRPEAVGWLEAERKNLVAAVDVCLREGLSQTGAAIALALAEFLTQTRHFGDLLHVMNAVLTSPAAGEADQYTRAAALNNFAVAMATTGDFDAAMSALQDAAHLGSEVCDRSAAYALMLSNLGATLLLGRRLDEAVRVLGEAAEKYAEIGDRPARAQALSNLGIALLDCGRTEEALAQLQWAQELSEQVQMAVHDKAVLLTNLGTALVRTGRLDEGMDKLATAAQRSGQSGDERGQATVLESLGRAMIEAGQFDEAIRCFSRAGITYNELGDLHSEARAGNNLGLALLEDDQDAQALLELERARNMYLAVDDRHSAAQCLNNVGNALRRLGRHDEAVHTLSQAITELRAVADEAALAEALLNLGLSHVAQGEAEAASAALSASVEAHSSLGDITARARALHALGRTAHSAGDRLAVQHLRAASEAFRQGRDASGLFDSLLLLSDLLNVTGDHGEAREAFLEALRLKESPRQDQTVTYEGRPGRQER